MPKKNLNINFAKGVDTKTDPWQVQPDNFLVLENSVFNKGNQLTKRNGFGQLTTINTDPSYIATLNDNLTAISTTISAYDTSAQNWVNKGTFQAAKVSSLPLIHNSINQIQSDTVIANGLALTAYTEAVNNSVTCKLVIADAVTGQNIVSPRAIPVPTGTVVGSPRVFLCSGYFVIVFTQVITATSFLRYIAISTTNLFQVNGGLLYTTALVTSNAYVSATTVAWDGVECDGRLYIAFNSVTGGQSVQITYLTSTNFASSQSGVSPAVFTETQVNTVFSLCADITNPTTPIIYVSFYSLSSTVGYTLAVDINLVTVFTPKQIIASGSVANLASSAENGICTVYSEVNNSYASPISLPSHYINKVHVTLAGTVGSVAVVARSVGLASKAFLLNGVSYFLAAFQSPFQPTYFLINGDTSSDANPQVIAKLAYENGGGYLILGLPCVNVSGDTVSMSYLYKDLIASLATDNNTPQTTTGGIYSQTGINLATFDLDPQLDAAEIAGGLHLGGGFLWEYDGYYPVEHNYFVWPDSIGLTTSTSGGSIVAHQYYYQVIYEWSDNKGNIHRSAPSIPVSVTTTGSTSSNTLTIPTLRLTYKTPNPVKIVIYRWSDQNQQYYQITSLTGPLLNTTTADTVTFVDTVADSSIVGNSIIYTTGGVVENVNGPSSNIITLFDTRMWLVDAEDPNLLWFSKQVIENTPVEMSDLFTFYIAPTTGSQGSTGPITALAPMDDKLIIFKNNAIYYINGSGPDNTGSNNQYTQPTFIPSTVGCINQQSIVFMPGGLMFQSDKGIWILDRSLSTSYIGAAVEGFTQGARVNSALNIPETNQVRFTLDTGLTLMFDYYYSQWGTFKGVSAVSSCLYQGLHSVLDKYGRVFQETPGRYSDGTEPVLMNFTTAWLNLASLQGFERAYYFYLLGQYYSPHKLTVGVAYNYNPSISHNSVIVPHNFSASAPSSFGDQPAPFGSQTAVEQWRVFFKQQKCQSFQITIQESFDPQYGTVPGAGLTLSGLNMTVAIKRGVRPVPARNSVG